MSPSEQPDSRGGLADSDIRGSCDVVQSASLEAWTSSEPSGGEKSDGDWPRIGFQAKSPKAVEGPVRSTM